MSTHKICFHGEPRKNIYLDNPQIWSIGAMPDDLSFKYAQV